jgi:hypothetical protein
MKILKFKKTGRTCYSFPWESKHAPCPWNTAKYSRVMIPLTEKEKIKSPKACHVQIVANYKLEEVRESRLTLR